MKWCEISRQNLRSVAGRGDLEAVEYICLSLRDIPLNEGDGDGKTALHLACGSGVGLDVMAALCAALAQRGLPLNCWDKQRRTALHMAAEHGDAEIVKFLIEKFDEKGYRLDDTAERAQSSLHIAAANGDLAVVKVLCLEYYRIWYQINYGYEGIPMHSAAENGHVDVLEFLCQEFYWHEAWINEDGCDYPTPLHLAANENHHLAVQTLYREINLRGRKCDDRGSDENYRTPLHSAACAGHLETVKVFCGEFAAQGLHLYQPRNYARGETVLHDAGLHSENLSVFLFLCQEMVDRGFFLNYFDGLMRPALGEFLRINWDCHFFSTAFVSQGYAFGWGPFKHYSS